jgi:NADH-ubiquinone oxidoreductase chain 5
VLKLGGQSTKVLDNGSIEYAGPHGLAKGLWNISNNIGKLNTDVVTTNALLILVGAIFYLALTPDTSIDTIILSITVLFSSILVHFKSKSYNRVF